jgi:hypothetical protein
VSGSGERQDDREEEARRGALPPSARKLVVLVGEDPGPRGDPDCALYDQPEGRAGHRLRLLAGLRRRDYFDAFARVNLLREWPGRWSAPRAREAARALLPALDGRLVVLLGSRVRDAFGVAWPRYAFGLLDAGPGRRRVLAAWMPHPSGRCREWNDPARAGEARAFFDLLLGWLSSDPSPHELVLYPGRELDGRGRLSAPSLAELAAAARREVAAELGELRGPPTWSARDEYGVAVSGGSAEPCEAPGCGRPWPTDGRAGRHLCPPCRSAASGHGL